MFDNNPLLDVCVSSKSFRGKIWGNSAAEVFMFLAKHVNQVMLAEELFPKRVTDKVESVRTDIGKDLVGEVSGVDIENEFTDDVVSREAMSGRLSRSGLEVPEFSGVGD